MGQKQVSIIPKAPVGRMILKAGAARVSQDAIDACTDILEQYADDVGKLAVTNAKHAGRKTVTDADVKLAAESLKK